MEAVTASPVSGVWALIEMVGAHSAAARGIIESTYRPKGRRHAARVYLLRRMAMAAVLADDIQDAEVRERILKWLKDNPDRRYHSGETHSASYTLWVTPSMKAQLEGMDDAAAFVREAIEAKLRGTP